MPLMIIGQFV